MTEIIARFAPSPTGYFHIGSARTALFNYLFARANNGKFLLRIEDTDRERSKDEHTQLILDSLDWIGLEHDGEIVYQSKNAPKHRELLQKMIADGFAYISKEEPAVEGGRAEVIRFKNPNKKVTFNDLIRGEITFDTTELKDFVIAKSLDEPLYHFAVVADDFEAGVTHIIRGEDHISNTPRQILIIEALGATIPQYAHLPLILSEDRSKLSKRKGAKSLTDFRDEGFLPEAIINYLALLGWNPGDEREIFKLDDLIKAFDISKINKSGAIFSEEKLKWVNKEHIKLLPTEDKEKYLEQHVPKIISDARDSKIDIEKIAEMILERNSTVSEIQEFVNGGNLDFISNDPNPSVDELLWQKNPDKNIAKSNLERLLSILEKIDSDKYTLDSVKEAVWPLAEEVGRGELLWPFRVSLSGLSKSPDPFYLCELLGKDRVITRVNNAIKTLSN